MPSELFEKKLREKLSQATIPPTPELWNNIEDQLKGGGRKRGMGIWILLALLLLASMGAMWAFWQMGEVSEIRKQATHIQSELLADPALVSPAITDKQDSHTVSANARESNLSDTPDFVASRKNNEPKNTEIQGSNKFASSTESATSSTASSTTSPTIESTPSTSTYRNSNYNKQTKSSDSKTYTSSVLSKDLSEGLISQVPQHTNSTLQGSHILSETSSISSPEEIVEVAGLQLRWYLPLSGIVKKQGPFIQLPKQAFRKKWAFRGYMDLHSDLREVSFPNFAASQEIDAPLITDIDPINAEDNAYSYEGLNSPGNLIVYAPQRSLSFGLQAEWQFHPTFSLQTGLEYGSFSLGSYVVGIVASNNIAYPPLRFGNPIARRSTLFTYHQLGLPIQLNYRLFAKKRTSINVYGGASLYAARAYSKSILQSANFYDFTESNVRGADGSIQNINSVSSDVPRLIQYNPFNLTVQGGFDYFYHLSDKSSIFFGPQLKFQATPIYREQQAEINEVPYYLGLRIGFRFAK